MIIGAALLIANNPRSDRPALRYSTLGWSIWIIFASAMICSAVGAALGFSGLLNFFGQDFQDLWRSDLWRPKRFMMTWGIHFGGYVGALIGTILAVIFVRRERRLKSAGGNREQIENA